MAISSLRQRAPEGAGVCLIVRAEVRTGAEDEFAGVMSTLAERVRAEETGCTSYVVTRMLGSREHFAVHARFASWEAFAAHAETPHLARVLPRLTSLLAAPISMEIFLELAPALWAIGVDDARREIESERHCE